MTEHHWLQARRAECNPTFAWHTNAVSLTTSMGLGTQPPLLRRPQNRRCPKAERADGRVLAQQQQAGQYPAGLWHKQTTFGADGYYSDTAYDFAQTSFHILTTEGIGRDILADYSGRNSGIHRPAS